MQTQLPSLQVLASWTPARYPGRFALGPILSLCLALLLLSAPARGQINGTGTIQGTVTDATGAVVPNAQVKIVDAGTNAQHTQTTTGAGFYSVAALPPGLYSVTVSASGFQTYTQQQVSLDALQVYGLNIQLHVGVATATVTVSSAPTPLNTANATLGSSMEVDTYKALPLILNGQPRDPTAFIYLTPGVTGGGGVDQFNGGQSNLNETYMDGVALDDVNQQSDWAPIHSTLSVDAVDQFQAQTSGISAAYQGQGIQNFTHKSGTNTYHGALFEYFRNTALDTWGFYAPYSINAAAGKALKPIEHQNEFGGTFGGYLPRLKNRAFFFFSYDNDLYLHGTNPGYTTIPMTLERTGDFTELLALSTPQPIYDPTTTVCAGSTCTRQPFMGLKNGVPTANVIPSVRLSPISQYMQKFMPPVSVPGVTNNWLGGFNTGFNYPRYSAKVDLDLIKNHRLSFLFTEGGRYANPPCCDSSGLPLPYTNTVGNTQNNLIALVTDTWTVNGHTVNKLSYDFNIGGFNGAGSINPSTLNPEWYATAAGITNIPPGQASDAFPKTSFGGANSPAQWAGGVGSAGGGGVKVFQIQDGLQIVKGRQSISIGGNFQWEDSNPILLQNGTYLSLSYSNNETAGFTGTSINTKQGASYASFMIGALDGAGISDDRPVTELYARYKNFSPYFQDDIKVTQKLTINAGLRWDVYSPWSEKENRFSFIDLGTTNPITGTPGTLLYGGHGPSGTYCNCRTPIKTWWKNLGPRLGFAYAVDSKTVVRGSFGIFYSHAGDLNPRIRPDRNTIWTKERGRTDEPKQAHGGADHRCAEAG